MDTMYGVRTDLRDDRETQKAHVFAGGTPYMALSTKRYPPSVIHQALSTKRYPPSVIHQASIFIQNPAPLPCNLTLSK